MSHQINYSIRKQVKAALL